jgi:hypothetical protein
MFVSFLLSRFALNLVLCALRGRPWNGKGVQDITYGPHCRPIKVVEVLLGVRIQTVAARPCRALAAIEPHSGIEVCFGLPHAIFH